MWGAFSERASPTENVIYISSSSRRRRRWGGVVEVRRGGRVEREVGDWGVPDR